MEEEFIESDYTKDDSYKTLQTINTWISNIDTKVSFTLAFIGVISTLIFKSEQPNALERVCEVSKLGELNGGEVIGAILVVILYILSFMSIICFMLAITARVKNENNNKSIFFFGSIASMSLSEYKEKINGISANNIVEDLQEQIYTNSKICSKKVKFYNLGNKILLLMIVVWFICTSFRLL
ncbi:MULTISPECIES: Pycsar system effector family protein [Clostridium]|uniref:Pycsar system effector family protein n=1 Tax=Clostridium TaxID=1485 RepID=UPI0018A8B544|nr:MULTISPECIES: Pycsar system effector family protein [Clostridium]MCQ2014613.1 DUF5706 domain-containing protein [Clostridium butyricum]MCQ2026758.1 DUF5706 domain-containing protein [Clostridium butyricum]MDB2136763.1 DUF5706 domain-containing protein [Clostridium butyricum]MDU1115048.1 DUF5706 domain-containing protein [Clostridium sp.]